MNIEVNNVPKKASTYLHHKILIFKLCGELLQKNMRGIVTKKYAGNVSKINMREKKE